MKHRSVLWAVLVGGSVAGALDILFAISFAGYNGTSRCRPSNSFKPRLPRGSAQLQR